MEILPRCCLSETESGVLGFLNFEELARSGIDAIFLTEEGEHATRFSEPGLYGWDCESILVMNPHCVKEYSYR